MWNTRTSPNHIIFSCWANKQSACGHKQNINLNILCSMWDFCGKAFLNDFSLIGTADKTKKRLKRMFGMYFILCQSSYTLLIDNIISLCAYIGNVTMIGFPGVSHHPEQNARKPVSSVYVYDIVHVYCICTVHVYVNCLSSRISDKLLPFAWQWGSSTGPILSCRLWSVWKGRFPSKYTINISSGLPSKYKVVTCRREPCTLPLTRLLLPRSLKQLFRCLEYKEFSKKSERQTATAARGLSNF